MQKATERISSAFRSGCCGATISATRATVASTHTASPASTRAMTVRSPASSVRDRLT